MNTLRMTSCPKRKLRTLRFTLRDLLKHMTPEQEDRYEKFRRSKFQKKAVKQVMRGAVNVPVNETTAIVMIGIAKVFVGEVVESGIYWLIEARSIMDERGESGPLQPTHIREALRRMENAKKHVRL